MVIIADCSNTRVPEIYEDSIDRLLLTASEYMAIILFTLREDCEIASDAVN